MPAKGSQNFSAYQQKVVKRYYENRDQLALQRLQELVTNLYLAEGKARLTAWKQIVSSLQKLKVPESRITQLQKQDDPALLAKLVTELLEKT